METIKKDLVTVIIPCYNYAHFLEDATDSIINQTYTSWECIIVDDGSTDNTYSVSEKICKKDKRFKYIKKVNGGLASTRNTGLQIARGEFIQFLDADDFLHHKKFEKQIAVFKSKRDVDICYSDFDYTNETLSELIPREKNRRSILKGDPYEDFLLNWVKRGLIIPIHSPLIRSSFLQKKGIQFNEKYKSVEDWLFWIEVSRHKAGFHYVDFPFALYRKHSSSMTLDIQNMNFYYLQAVFEVYGSLTGELEQRFKENYSEILAEEISELNNRIVRLVNSKYYKTGLKIYSPFAKIKKLFK